MLWLTWRQFRPQAYAAAAVILVVAVVLAINAAELAHIYTETGLASCTGQACDPLVNTFLKRARTASAGLIYNLAIAFMYLVPPLIGVFWGAPLVARELESGTFRMVWTQSITRTRWLAIKVGVLGLAAMAVTAVLDLAAGWSGRHFSDAAMDRLATLQFGAHGVVPIAYAAFAFALGVTAGIVARRAIPAMAISLFGYTAAVLAMATVLRQHILPAQHATLPLDLNSIDQFTTSQDLSQLTVIGVPDLPGAWILSNQTVTPSGDVFTGPASAQFCGENSGPKACLDWIGTLGLRESVSYHSAGRYWALQWTEAGIFLALAAALLGFGFWWLRSRAS